MGHQINTRQAPPQVVLARRVHVGMHEIAQAIGSTFEEEYATLGQQGIASAGPPFVAYESMGQEDWDVLICAPAARAGDPPDGYTFESLPAATVATTLHRGPYETIARAYEALQHWIDEHGWVSAGPVREIYLSPPDVPPEKIETVIEWPVEEAPIEDAVPSPS